MAGSRTLKLSILADVDNLKKNLGEGSKEVEGFGGKLENFGKVAAAAFAAAAAAAVAYAGKLAIDGVKAAIEDEAAQNRLANALKNVTGATDAQIAAVEDQIYKMSLANGIADDQLRPAFQRLAVATGDLTKAGDSLSLALDISAATGKSVEQVANALGKAYEGNTGALGRLGIGLSSAEIKSMGLDATMKQLSETFGGAATVQANTLEGQIARLKVSFDEAKESVGAGLLPIVRSLLDYFVNTFIPKLIEVKDRAIKPIVDAFNENEDAMRALWNFGKTYLVPFFENTLFKAIEGVGKAIGGIINVVGFVMREVEKLVNAAIGGINAVLSAYNAIPFLPNVGLLGKVNFAGKQTNQNANATIELPFGQTYNSSSLSAFEKEVGGATNFSRILDEALRRGVNTDVESLRKVAASMSKPEISNNIINQTKPISAGITKSQESAVSSAANVPSMSGITTGLSAFRLGEAISMGQYTINVNAPSIIDEEGFARAVVDAMNQAQARTGSGGGKLATVTL